VFFLNLPLALIALALSLRFIDESRDPSRSSGVDASMSEALTTQRETPSPRRV
jgi:hypothetical protein